MTRSQKPATEPLRDSIPDDSSPPSAESSAEALLDPAAETPTGSSDSSDRGPAGGGPPESDLDDLRRRFAEAGEAERARIAEHLLQFAPWADIWRVASRETIIELFPQLELPGTLRQAWARHLGIAGTAPGN